MDKSSTAQPIFCDVCNIGVSSELSMHDHVKGRRHLQTLSAMERRKAMARNSLYCHGFPPDCPPAHLKEYFMRFGTVTRILVETIKGCYCIVQYETDEPVLMALNQHFHQLHGFNLTVRPRKPITTQRRGKANRAAPENEDDQDRTSHSQLMARLLTADSVLGQMEMLYETLRLSDADLDRRKNVCSYLQNVLTQFFPTCSIHQFGSSVNGFGMEGCDMDIFVDLHDTDVSLQWEQSLRQKVTEGPLLPSQLRPLSLVHRVKLMSRILQQHAPHCADVLFVPSARCPIVRFVHLPTGIKCDLSINNRLALRNTQLLQMCGDDRRVRLLVFAVRYWGKVKNVAGNTNCGPRMSNYCLTILVLFYLANSTKPPILLPPETLAHLATEPNQNCLIDNWNCTLPDVCPASLNTQPADELLQGFFEFYNKLPLSTSVILTRTGTVMLLTDFLAEKDRNRVLSDFKVKALAVQDPFVLQHNIAQNITPALRDTLVQELAYANFKTSKWRRDDVAEPSLPPPATDQPHCSQSSCSSTSSSDCLSALDLQDLWGLPYLFSTVDCVPSAMLDTTGQWSSLCEVASTTAASSESSHQLRKRSPWSHWTFPVTLDMTHLTLDVLRSLSSQQRDFRVVWFYRVRTLLVWALREVFLYTVMDAEGGRVLDEGVDLDADVDLDDDDEKVKEEEGKEEEVEEKEDEEGMCVVEEESKAVESSIKDAAAASARKDVVGDEGTSLPATGHTDEAQVPAVHEATSPQSQGPPLSLSQPPQQSACCSSAQGEEEAMMMTSDSHQVQGSSSVIMELSQADSDEAGGGTEDSGVNASDCAGGVGQVGGKGVQQQLSPRSDQETSLASEASPMSEVSQLSPHTNPQPQPPSHPAPQAGPSSEPHSLSLPSNPQVEHQSLSMDEEMVAEAAAPATHGEPSDKRHQQPAGTQQAEESGAAQATCPQPLNIEYTVPGEEGTERQAAGSSSTPKTHSTKIQITETQNADSSVTHSTKLSKLPAERHQASSSSSGQPKAGPSSGQQPQKCRAFRVYCEGSERCWHGRKVTRMHMLKEGFRDDLELEKHISRRVSENDTAGPPNILFKFHVKLTPVPRGENPVAEVSFEPASSMPKEFSVFPTYFKSYFSKLVPKQLLPSPTV